MASSTTARARHCLKRAAAVACGAGLTAFALASPATASTAALTTTVPPAATPTPPRVVFGVQPATATATDSRAAFSYNVSAGAALVDHVAIVNYSLKPIKVAVYAADAVNLADGGFSLEPGNVKAREAGAWISVPGRFANVTVGARVNAEAPPIMVIVPITVQVPADASPGDHAAGVVAALGAAATDRQGANVQLEQRVGARVYFRVSGALRPKLAVEHVRVSFHGGLNPVSSGSATVRYTVRNAGNIKLAARQRLSAGGWFGVTAPAVHVPDLPLLLPGSSVTVTVHVPKLWATLRDHTTITLTPLRPQIDTDPSLPVVHASTGFWAVPWTLLVVLVLIAVVASATVLRRRRRGAA